VTALPAVGPGLTTGLVLCDRCGSPPGRLARPPVPGSAEL